MSEAIRDRERTLHDLLRQMGSTVVAFSAGADSAFLACTARAILGRRMLAVTGSGPSYPDHHRRMALRLAREFDLQHEFIETREIDRPAYRANAPDRCYHCKTDLYDRLADLARARGFAAVVDGSNADDRSDYRPGRQAAREHGVRSPLDEAGLTKADIRALSRAMGLPTWDEPASACLASRLPYGSVVTPAKLHQVERAEAVVRALGFRVFRVRHHDEVARIEIAREEMARALDSDVSGRLVAGLTDVGYRFVALDLHGYRLGSLNEAIRLRAIP